VRVPASLRRARCEVRAAKAWIAFRSCPIGV
jgi:hypothetical protein